MKLTVRAGCCSCGCGAKLKNPNRNFRQGHDAKLKSALIAAKLAGEDVHATIDGKTTATEPIRFAKRFGVGQQVKDAVARRRGREPRKAQS